MLDIIVRIIFNRSNQTGIHVFDLNVENFRHADASVSQENRAAVIFPDVFPQGTDPAAVWPDGHQSHHQIIRQVRERNIFI